LKFEVREKNQAMARPQADNTLSEAGSDPDRELFKSGPTGFVL
jgi:hypothetical protein